MKVVSGSNASEALSLRLDHGLGGFRIVGRAWLETHWPSPPDDFDFGYWNSAPADQQTDYLPPDAHSPCSIWSTRA